MGVRDLLAAKPTGKLRVDLSSTNLDTSSWTALSSSLPASCTAITVAYTGIGILKLAKVVSTVTTELPLYITPGQNQEELIPLELSKAWGLSAKCEDQAVTSGELVINFFG